MTIKHIAFGVGAMALALGLAACAQSTGGGSSASVTETQTGASRSLSVSPGGSVLIDANAQFDKTCKTKGFVTYKPSKALANGTLRTERENVMITSVNDPSRAACVGKSLPGVAVYYDAGQSFGTDTFTLMRTNANGKTRDINVTVDIE